MKRIGAERSLSGLNASGGIGRQQFRTNLRCEHAGQHLFKLRMHLAENAHQILHKRLRHAGVDRVHGHMVAVECGPAQSELAHIGRSQHKTADSIGDIHENLRAFPRLSIFKNHVIAIFRMPNIGKVLPTSRTNIDRAEFNAKPPHQCLCTGTRSRRSTKARHGDAEDVRTRTSELIHSRSRNEERQRTVETAGNPDHNAGNPRLAQSLRQPRALHAQNFPGALSSAISIFRNKGCRIHLGGPQCRACRGRWRRMNAAAGLCLNTLRK